MNLKPKYAMTITAKRTTVLLFDKDAVCGFASGDTRLKSTSFLRNVPTFIVGDEKVNSNGVPTKYCIVDVPSGLPLSDVKNSYS